MKRLAFLFFTSIVLISSWVYSDPQNAEKLERGLAWLDSQQSQDGAFYSSAGFADALQVTSESVVALEESQNTVFDKAAATAYVEQNRQSHTESLYWKVLLNSLSQQSTEQNFEKIKLNQNRDGGFGSYQGYDSNALDSAFALKAALIAETDNAALVGNVLSYLLQDQRDNGSFALNLSNDQSVYVTSLVLSALNSLKFHFQVSAEIEKATAFLVAQINEEGGSLLAWQKAMAIIAIRQATVDTTDYKSVSDILFDQQLANGSWQDDAYTTALILKSSQAVSAVEPPAVVTEAAVSGRVLDRDSGIALSGASLQLFSYETSSVAKEGASNGQGLFQLSEIPAGNYQLTVSAEGYLPATADLTLTAGANLELGSVTLAQVSDRAVVQGTVLSAEDGQPLPDVQVSIGTVTVISDQSGFYRMNVEPGATAIQVVLAGYQTVNATADLTAGSVTTFSPSMYLEGSQQPQVTGIQGRVIDFNSLQPVANVAVSVNGAAVATTDQDGLFSATNLVAGETVVELSATDYQPATYTATIQENATSNFGDLTLRQIATNPLTTVMGLIKDAQDDTPIDGAEVRIPELDLVVMTGNDGRYLIEGITETDFTVEMNAVGYFGASSQASADLGTTIVANANLHRAAATGIEINEMRAATGETYEAFSEAELDVGFLNTGDEAKDVRLYLKVVNSQGEVVEQFPVVSIPLGGTLADALMTLEPGVQTEAEVEWHIRDQAADFYNLIVQAYSPEGQLLVERGELIHVLPTRRIGGHAGFSPPITQLAENRPIAIEATIANRGNTNLPPQQLTATVTLKNKGFGPERVDASISEFVSSSEVLNARGSALDAEGNYYFLNNNGREVKKRSADGQVTVYASGFSNAQDILVENGEVHVLTYNSIITIDEQLNQTVLALDFSSARRFIYLGDQEYFVWNSSNLYRFKSEQSSEVVLGRGLSDARSIVKTNDGTLYIADSSGEVFTFSEGQLTVYHKYAKAFSRMIAFEGERLIGIDTFAREIYELLPDGSLSLIANGFSQLTDIHERQGGLVVTEYRDNKIIQVSLDGSKEVLAHATFTGVSLMVEQGGELYGVRNNNELVKINDDNSVEYIGRLPGGARSFIANNNGGFWLGTYNRIYSVSTDASYEELDYGRSALRHIRESHDSILYKDNNGSYPISRIESGAIETFIDRQFTSPSVASKVPGSDDVLVMSSDRYVYRVSSDLTKVKLQQVPFTSYQSLYALNANEFIAGDHNGRRLVKFNSDGTNEVLVDLGFSPRYLAADASGNIYISERYGNRVFKWNETDGLSQHKTLNGSVYYGFTVDENGVIYYVRSNRSVYRHIDSDEYLARLSSNPTHLEWAGDGVVVSGYYRIQKVETDGTLINLVNTGAIQSDNSIYSFVISDGLLAITGSGQVVRYNAQSEETSVGLSMGGRIRDFQVTEHGTYILDSSGRIGLVDDPSKLATKLYGNSSYQRIDVLSQSSIVARTTNGVDKLNVATDEKAQLVSGIASTGAFAIRNDGRVQVFDSSNAQYASVQLSDGQLLDRYYDIKSPSLIAANQNTVAIFQNGHQLYSLENSKLKHEGTFNSPKSLRYVDDHYVVVRGTDIYSGQSLNSLTRVVNYVSGEQQFVDLASIDGANIEALTKYEFVDSQNGQLQYYGFNLNNVEDIDLLNSGDLIFTARNRVITLDDQNVLNAYPFKLSHARSLQVESDDLVIILDGGKFLYQVNLATGTKTQIEASALENASVTFIKHVPNEGGYLLLASSSIARLAIAEVPDEVSVGDIIYQNTVDYPGTLKGTPALPMDFGSWLPPESGDYEVTITSSDSSVDGALVNQIHVGPLAEGQISTQLPEALPGDQVVSGNMLILGADSSAITTIDPDATSLAGTSYTRGRAIAADSFGNIYAGDQSVIKVMTPDGTISDYVMGSLGIRNGMAIDNDNNIYAGTYNGILKVTPNKEISFNDAIGAVNAVVVDSNNVMYAATNSGVYKFEDRETPVQLASIGLNQPQAIAVDAYNNVYVLNRSNRISKINQDGSVSDYYTEASFEYEGVNLVADCSRNLIFAPTYDPVGKPRPGEEDKVVQLMADTRESRLVLDGPVYDAAMNDIDVLYYDRFGDRFLIWTDRSGGKMFSFPVICGGIDVELHVTTRADVHVAFSEQLPEQAVEVDGKQQLVWSLEDVDVDGVNIPAQFSFDNLQEGERRPVLESAFLRFNNTFDEDNPIDLPLNIPSVLAITRVNLTGHTDRSTYLPNTDVAVSLEFSNESAGPLSGEIQYGIYDQQGTAVVEFDTVAIQDQIPQQTNLIQTSWNTAETFADGYVLKAQFNNARGELVESIEYPFSIISSDTPDTLGFSSGISTDKVLYEKGETATISTRVLNTSANTVAENLIARIRLLDVDDNMIFSFDQTVQALYPNGVHSKQTPFVLSAVSAGNYQAQLMVVDSLSGQVKDTQSYTFAVNQGGVAGSGLSGTTTATPTQVNKGQAFTCVHDITNVGTANSGVTELRSFVVRAENDELYNAVDLSSDIAAGSNETFTYQYNTLDMPLGGYACVMQANLQGQWQTLSSAGVLVREDPVLSRLTATVQAANDEVYLGEPTSCIDTVTYVADSGSTDINLIQNLVSIDSGLIIDTDSASVDLNANEGQVLSRAYGANQLSLGQYRCDLYAERSGSQRLIGQDTFTVVEPPVRVSTSLLDGQRGRLLLLTDNSRQCSALEDIHVKVNWGSEFSSNTNLTVKVFNADGIVVDTEVVSQWDVEINAGQPIDDADVTVQATLSGDVQVLLSAPVHKLGHQYRVEVEAQRGWFYRETKSWDLQTDCDRPFTVGEIIEDIHLLGYKWFHDPSDSVKDLDPYGPVSAPLVTAQNAFLEEQLQSQGWEYTLVHNAHDFTRAMRNGDYAAYVILSERAHLPVLAQKELREHVFAGKGLVMAGSHDKRNLFVEPALGLTVTGRHPWATGLQNSADEPLESFPFHHLIQTVSLDGADVEAEYSLIADDLTPEELQEGWENLHDAIPLLELIRDYRRRAVMTTDYGLGRSTFMGYDALAVATELGAQSESATLLFNHIERVASVQPQAIAFKEWPVVVTITNEGSAVTGTATLTLPEGMDLVSTGDFEQDGNVWVMTFALDEAANGETTEYQKTVYVRLPEGDGAQAINLYVEAIGANGGQADVQASLEVSSTQAATMDELTELGHTVKHNHWYEPHFYILYADLLLAKTAVENENWWAAQTLLIGASNLILSDSREDVMQLRLAIDEQIRLIGKQL